MTLLALAGCELIDKVCIGDCPDAVDTDAVASVGDSTMDPHDSGSSGGETLPPGVTTTAVDPTSEPADVCDLTDDLVAGAGCMDGVQAPGEFCFVLGQGGPGFPEGIVSTVPGLFDGIGGVDLLISHPDRTVSAMLDGPAPHLDMSSVAWPEPFPADSLHFTGVGDLDGDGDVDAVGRRVGGTGDTVEILLTDAASLAEAKSVSVGTIVFGPAVVDWDLDGDLDLLVVTSPTDNPENAILLRGDGTGIFNVEPQFGFSPSEAALAVGALQADGKPDDIVAAGEEGSIVAVSPPISSVDLGASAVVLRLEIAELNGDGLGDVVALVEDSVTGGASLAVLLQGLDGDEAVFTVSWFPLRCGTKTFALGDIDQDGALDVAAGGPGESFVTIRRGDGLGGFPQLYTVSSSEVDEVHVADFNGDGSIDLALINYAWGSFDVAPNLP